jgi:hypothetical protein
MEHAEFFVILFVYILPGILSVKVHIMLALEKGYNITNGELVNWGLQSLMPGANIVLFLMYGFEYLGRLYTNKLGSWHNEIAIRPKRWSKQ